MEKTPKIFDSEFRFLQVLWEKEPVNSTQLVQVCRERLGWSKATTYTVIRRLSERGVVVNEHAMVRALVTKEQAEEAEIDELVNRTFGGSIPQFLAAFTKKKNLSREEIDAIQKMIDEYKM